MTQEHLLKPVNIKKTLTLKMIYQDTGPSEDPGLENFYYILIRNQNKLEPIPIPNCLENHFPKWSIWEISEDLLEAEKGALSDTLCPCRSAFLAESSSIISKVSEPARKNSDARKYALGGALLKLAATDPRAYEVLKQAWAMAQKDKPRAFEDANLLIQDKANQRGEIK